MAYDSFRVWLHVQMLVYIKNVAYRCLQIKGSKNWYTNICNFDLFSKF